MVKHRKPPSRTWRAFLENHVKQLVSVDFFVGPTLSQVGPANQRNFRLSVHSGPRRRARSASDRLLGRDRYREKGHHALFVALRELYAGEIERSLLQEFEHGMYLRQEADYGMKFSTRGAQEVIETAGKMLARTTSILKIG
ncbi:MAG: hypothetical protein FJW35_04800 [Acidobacteria bacterium]|nr:hypothetical protein [Acidobacteriota bacterium]